LKHVVFGSAGQLGRALSERLLGEVVPLTHAAADLTQPNVLRAALTELRPSVVFNCAAYNFVDRAEREPDAAFAANAWGARSLASVCRDLDCTLVHFSSDYIFGLETGRTAPYREADTPGPISVYGLSKLTGEYLVRAISPKHIVIRTCGLYGARGSGGKGSNFVETMLRLAEAGQPIRVVNDQTCTPSYAADVAEATIQLVTTGGQGLYHVTNAGSCSWHEFAAAIFELAGLEAKLTAITSQEYGAAARRPVYSVLGSRLAPLRPWREALSSFLEARRQIGAV